MKNIIGLMNKTSVNRTRGLLSLSVMRLCNKNSMITLPISKRKKARKINFKPSLLIVFITLLISTSLSAATYYTRGIGGNWGTPATWSLVI